MGPVRETNPELVPQIAPLIDDRWATSVIDPRWTGKMIDSQQRPQNIMHHINATNFDLKGVP